MIPAQSAQQHWARLVRWARSQQTVLTVLCAVLLATVLVPLAAGPLNALTALGFPLGFLLVAQAGPILLVVLLFWYVRRVNGAEDRL